MVPFLAYALARRVSFSEVEAFLLAVYFAYDPTLSQGHFNVHAYAWTRALLLVFLLIYVRILERRTPREILLLVLIFVATFLIYWTTPVWMIFLLVPMCLTQVVGTRRAGTSRVSSGASVALLLAFLVIYLAFSKVLYDQYLPAVVRSVYGDPEEAWVSFVWHISRLFFEPQGSGPYQYAGSSLANTWLSWVLVARYVVLFPPHVTYIVIRLWKSVRTRSLSPLDLRGATVLIWGAATTVVGHTIIYSLRGHVSFRPALVLFPITGLICIHRLKFPRSVRLGFVATLSLLAVVGFFLGYPNTVSFDIEPSAQWFFQHARGVRVLTDLHTAGKYQLEQVERQQRLSIDVYDSTAYHLIVGEQSAAPVQETLKERWDYLIVDLERLEQPVLGRGWQVYEPLSRYFRQIYDNHALNAVYNDGRFLILCVK